MRARWDRLVCRLRGHRRVRVIEQADLTHGSTLFAMEFRIGRWRIECSRCGTVLERSQ